MEDSQFFKLRQELKAERKRRREAKKSGLVAHKGKADKKLQTLRFFHFFTIFKAFSGHSLEEVPHLDKSRKSWIRGHVSEILGTQQPTFTMRTGMTTLVTNATPNLVQVVAMDVTGLAAWSSIANIFDEYRVKRAKLCIVPSYSGYGASATTIAAMPVIVVVDYDDATAIASLTNALQYDTHKEIYMGSSNSKTFYSKEARPEGQPDLAWVTTATPTVPFWFKFWSVTNLIPSSAQMGSCYIECDIEFRQVA